MKTQQLISTGFAITALAAASVPAVAWTLLGDMMEPPAATAMASAAEPPSILMAEVAAPLTVSYRFLEPSERKEDSTTW